MDGASRRRRRRRRGETGRRRRRREREDCEGAAFEGSVLRRSRDGISFEVTLFGTSRGGRQESDEESGGEARPPRSRSLSRERLLNREQLLADDFFPAEDSFFLPSVGGDAEMQAVDSSVGESGVSMWGFPPTHHTEDSSGFCDGDFPLDDPSSQLEAPPAAMSPRRPHKVGAPAVSTPVAAPLWSFEFRLEAEGGVAAARGHYPAADPAAAAEYSQLNREQRRVIDLALAGRSVFFCGPAGTGKSRTLEVLTRELRARGKTVAVTGTTGVAAQNIGGMTLHGWAGMGLATDTPYEHAIKILSHESTKPVRQRWRTTDVLIIDEISMLSGQSLDKMSEVGQFVRGIGLRDFRRQRRTVGRERACLLWCWEQLLASDTRVTLRSLALDNVAEIALKLDLPKFCSRSWMAPKGTLLPPNNTPVSVGWEPWPAGEPQGEEVYLWSSERSYSDPLDHCAPFGGIQLIFVGDFHQLPPVKGDDFEMKQDKLIEKLRADLARTDHPIREVSTSLFRRDRALFAFESHAWKRIVKPSNTVELSKIFRQVDPDFQDMLNSIRHGCPDPRKRQDITLKLKKLSAPPALRAVHRARLCFVFCWDHWRTSDESKSPLGQIPTEMLSLILKELGWEFQDSDAPRLVTRNVDAGKINNFALMNLFARDYHYNAVDQIAPGLSQDDQKTVMKSLSGDEKLQLRAGARVMLLENVSVDDKLVNGSVGKVVGFLPHPHQHGVAFFECPHSRFQSGDNQGQAYPLVEFKVDGQKVRLKICPVERTVEVAGVKYGSRVQLPLRLCWAITIHKSQGMTMDKVDVNLAHCRTDGQGYVALSRVTSPNGLQLRHFDENIFRVSDRVEKFEESAAVARAECAPPRKP